LEILRTREKRLPDLSGVVGVIVVKVASEAVGACVAVIVNPNVPKDWTFLGITTDYHVILSGLQRKSPRRDVVRILQREKETLHTYIGLETAPEA
jgi:hypothetical protein